MSTFFEQKDTCFICGQETEFMVLGSSNSFGSQDLDTRPAPMVRDTMSLWLRECPHCGYVAGSIADATGVSRQWLQGEYYTTCNGQKFSYKMAARFYKHYLISLEENKTEAAFNAALQAAWVCDDAADEENAIHCRNCALTELDKMLALYDEEGLHAIRADILRRTGQFEKLVAEYAGRTFENELIGQIMAFQIKKAEQKDTRCYRVADVTDGGSV